MANAPKKDEMTPEDREVMALVLVVVGGFFLGIMFLFAIVASGTL